MTRRFSVTGQSLYVYFDIYAGLRYVEKILVAVENEGPYGDKTEALI